MKHRPNILAKNLKANQYSDMLDKMRNMVLNDETGSTLAERPEPIPSKTKVIGAAPILNLIKNEELDKTTMFVNMVLNDETGSVLADKPLPTPSKAKSNPIPNVQPNYLDKILDYKLDMFDFIASDTKLHPDLLVEYDTYYVATITTKAPMQGYDSLTSKDFDIYVSGMRLDVTDYKVSFNDKSNMVVTMEKFSLINGLVKDNFLICGAFNDIFLVTELNTNIIDTENDLGLVI
jgi:hypothetical protein